MSREFLDYVEDVITAMSKARSYNNSVDALVIKVQEPKRP
jgi:hypothetical protein